MKAVLLACVFLTVALIEVHCDIYSEKCVQENIGSGLPYSGALRGVQSASPQSPNLGFYGSKRFGRRKRDVSSKPSYEASYEPPNTVIDAGKVIVMPPPGYAPKDQPQPGQPGGGAPPETDPYTANMAPEDTVPVAVFPPFNEYKKHPTKCVIFSELTDYEKKHKKPAEPYRHQKESSYGPSYRGKREAEEWLQLEGELITNGNATIEEEEILARFKRQSPLNFLSAFYQRRPSRPRLQATSSQHVTSPASASSSSSYAPPRYEAPQTYEKPPKVVYRTFGYICRITVSESYCEIGTECDREGNRLTEHRDYRKPNYGKSSISRMALEGNSGVHCSGSVIRSG